MPLAETEAGPHYEGTYEVTTGKYPLSRFLFVYVNKAPGKPLILPLEFIADAQPGRPGVVMGTVYAAARKQVQEDPRKSASRSGRSRRQIMSVPQAGRRPSPRRSGRIDVRRHMAAATGRIKRLKQTTAWPLRHQCSAGWPSLASSGSCVHRRRSDPAVSSGGGGVDAKCDARRGGRARPGGDGGIGVDDAPYLYSAQPNGAVVLFALETGARPGAAAGVDCGRPGDGLIAVVGA